MTTKSPPAATEWLSKQEAASYLGVTVRFLRSRMEDHTLPYHRMGPRLVRFNVEDLDAFAAAGRVGTEVENEGEPDGGE